MTIDVRCLPYMPLHIERLRRSKAWLRCKRRPELAFYLMNLWMRAWHEVPAGSIEADDDVLADAAMCSPDEWERIKGDVLQGWDLREGRHFQPQIVEAAEMSFEAYRRASRREDKRLLMLSIEWAEIRSSVFRRDHFTCQYCGAVGRRLECDHIIPVARGGTTALENLATACMPCNRSKGSKLLSEWRQ